MSDHPTPTPLERLATARHTNNLKLNERRRGPVDYIIAAGLVDQVVERERQAKGLQPRERQSVGSSLLHVHLGDGRLALKSALQSVTALVKKLNARRNWRLNGASVMRVAEMALLHHVAPACPHCHGRGWEMAPGTNRLSGRMCKHCNGSGSRPLAKRHGNEVNAVLAELSSIEDVVERAVRKLTR